MACANAHKKPSKLKDIKFRSNIKGLQRKTPPSSRGGVFCIFKNCAAYSGLALMLRSGFFASGALHDILYEGKHIDAFKASAKIRKLFNKY